jgi:DNA-binding NarL/FixJ family response regulator
MEYKLGPDGKMYFGASQQMSVITDGYTGQEIARAIFVSFSTVEHYRSNILLKMDVKNTAALIKKAMTLGLVK